MCLGLSMLNRIIFLFSLIFQDIDTVCVFWASLLSPSWIFCVHLDSNHREWRTLFESSHKWFHLQSFSHLPWSVPTEVNWAILGLFWNKWFEHIHLSHVVNICYWFQCEYQQVIVDATHDHVNYSYLGFKNLYSLKCFLAKINQYFFSSRNNHSTIEKILKISLRSRGTLKIFLHFHGHFPLVFICYICVEFLSAKLDT